MSACYLLILDVDYVWCIIMLIAVSWIRTDSLLGNTVIFVPAK